MAEIQKAIELIDEALDTMNTEAVESCLIAEALSLLRRPAEIGQLRMCPDCGTKRLRWDGSRWKCSCGYKELPAEGEVGRLQERIRAASQALSTASLCLDEKDERIQQFKAEYAATRKKYVEGIERIAELESENESLKKKVDELEAEANKLHKQVDHRVVRHPLDMD